MRFMNIAFGSTVPENSNQACQCCMSPEYQDLTTRAPSPTAAETWGPAPRRRPLNPGHEGDRGQQVPPSSGQAVPRLHDQVPAAPPGPCHQHEPRVTTKGPNAFLLSAAGPRCAPVCPNKLLGKTKVEQKNPLSLGHA